jgi:hypothetical protein
MTLVLQSRLTPHGVVFSSFAHKVNFSYTLSPKSDFLSNTFRVGAVLYIFAAVRAEKYKPYLSCGGLKKKGNLGLD